MPARLACHCSRHELPFSTRRLLAVCNLLLQHCGVADHSFDLLLTDDREIAELNGRYRNKAQPTNVLSFPLAGEEGDEMLATLPVKELGDIVISVETARREALLYGQPLRQRFTWLLVHGLLHLLGYDHERSAAEEARMEARERELLTTLNQQRNAAMTKLAINVDHVATIRQARGIAEPDPIAAAAICEMAGAAGIVVHLREDRRHIQDRDVRLLRQTIKTKLNLEMGANKEIIDIALEIRPDLITLVPEKREELTTEGGLDVVSQEKKIAKVIEKMARRSIPVSLFLDPDPRQLAVARKIGATFVELHTGRYCDAIGEEKQQAEFALIAAAADEAESLGLRVCAGHGLSYHNTAPIAAIEAIEELSIGHAIISRAVFSGLDNAVRDMLAIIRQADLSF